MFKFVNSGLTFNKKVWEEGEVIESLPPNYPVSIEDQKDKWRGKFFYVQIGSIEESVISQINDKNSLQVELPMVANTVSIENSEDDITTEANSEVGNVVLEIVENAEEKEEEVLEEPKKVKRNAKRTTRTKRNKSTKNNKEKEEE